MQPATARSEQGLQTAVDRREETHGPRQEVIPMPHSGEPGQFYFKFSADSENCIDRFVLACCGELGTVWRAAIPGVSYVVLQHLITHGLMDSKEVSLA